MSELLCFLRWWRKRDSESAFCVLIDIAGSLSKRDLEQASDYLLSLKQLQEALALSRKQLRDEEWYQEKK
jgi:hypothetical protein